MKNNKRVSEKVKLEAEKYNWKAINFPTPLNQIDKFEKQNSLSVSVYGFDENEVLYPLRITKTIKDKHVNLLLIRNEGNTHYIIMQDLSPFVNKERNGKCYPCRYCLHSFIHKELRIQHEPNC